MIIQLFRYHVIFFSFPEIEVLNILFGQDGLDDPENAPKIKAFKKLFAKERLPMLKFEEIERIFEEATLKGTEESLDPDKEQSEE